MDGGHLVAEVRLAGAQNATEGLVSSLSRIAAVADWRLNGVGRVVVGIGPGGFTGVRVGVAAARALVLATGAELVPVSYFDMAAAAARNYGVTGTLEILKDVRRGHIMRRCIPPDAIARGGVGLLTLDQARALVDRTEATVVGDGLITVGLADAWGIRMLADATASRFAAIAADLGYARPADRAAVVPSYARPPDALPQRGVEFAGERA